MSLQIILKNSSVSGKEPTASQLANGELALNYHADGPFISCKDSAGTVRRIAGVWISTTAPTSPTPGEFWLDTNTDPAKLKVYKDGTDTWIETITIVAASTTAAGVVELATDAETQAGSLANRAVTPASLQSKVSDSTTTTSSTTIASSTAVKSAKDVADAALPAAGGTISGNLIVSGDLTVNGTTTTIDTETLVVKDKNIEMGVVDTPTDVTADGGGITLKGATDKTLNWVDSTDSWTSSENVDLASGKTYKIAGTDVLSGTTLGSGVTGSSLTSVGTITSGTWNGTQIATAYIADSAVTSAKIEDGTIVNADVNASAAIAGTKIDPDFGSQTVETTGVFSAAGGAEATPSITFTGDLNTGIYSPGADQVGIATGGSPALVVDASQNVGIGATSPGALLHASASYAAPSTGGIDASTALIVSNNNVASGEANISLLYRSNAKGRLNFGSQIIEDIAYVEGGPNYLAFGTGSGSVVAGERLRLTSTGEFEFTGAGSAGTTQAVYFSGSAPVDSLVVDSNGRTGIGTSSPAALLHLEGASPVIQLEDTDASGPYSQINGNGSGGRILLSADAGNTGTGSTIEFAVDGDVKAVIDSSGQLGVGTISPDNKLDIREDGTFNQDSSGQLVLRGTTDSNKTLRIGFDTTSDYGYLQSIQVGTAAKPLILQPWAGNVGVGTTSPGNYNAVADNLVVSSTGHTGITINAGTTDSSNILFADSDNDSQGQIRYFHSTDSLSFGVSGGDAVRINSSGYLGIGNTSPDDYLTIANTSTSGDIGLRFKGDASSRQFIMFGDPGGAQLGDIMYDHGTNAMRFRVNNSTAATIDSSGHLGLGTTSPNALLHISNSGAGNDAVLINAALNGTGEGLQINGNTRTSGDDATALLRVISRTNSDALRVNVSGNVGIGSNSPSTILHIKKDTADGAAGIYPEIRLDNANATGRSSLTFYNGSTKQYDIFCYNGDGDLRFRTNTTEVARFLSTGQAIFGSGSATSAGSTNYAKLYIKGDETSTDNAAMQVLWKGNTPATNDRLGRIVFAAGSTGAPGAWIDTYADGEWFSGGDTTDQPTRLEFSTCKNGDASPTTRFMIDSGGQAYLGALGTVPDGAGLTIYSNSTNNNIGSLYVRNYETTADACIAAFVTATNSTLSSNTLIRFGINSYSSGSGQINANGAGACAFGAFSDERLKENIIDLPSQWENIKNLRPVEFDFIESQGGEHQVGFIAQEFETVYPDAVGSSPMFIGAEEASDEERLTITGWSKTEARLVKALQEAIAKIEVLEAKVAALEGN